MSAHDTNSSKKKAFSSKYAECFLLLKYQAERAKYTGYIVNKQLTDSTSSAEMYKGKLIGTSIEHCTSMY